MNKSDRESLDILLKNYNPKADGLIKYKEWKEKYLDELLDFKYIHSIDDFKNLNLGGVIKVITLSNEELKKGGILVKIATDTKNKLYALLTNNAIDDLFHKLSSNRFKYTIHNFNSFFS